MTERETCRKNQRLTNSCIFCYKKILPEEACCCACKRYLTVQPHVIKLKNKCVCISAFRYDGIYRTSILKYKSGGKFKNLSKSYSVILSRTVSKLYSEIDFDCYTGVPAKKSFFVFDQANKLAFNTASIDNVEYRELLIQISAKEIQHRLDETERKNNVSKIYKCIDAEYVKGKVILLFDDVITTGSTLEECSDALLRCGAKKVYCVTVDW